MHPLPTPQAWWMTDTISTDVWARWVMNNTQWTQTDLPTGSTYPQGEIHLQTTHTHTQPASLLPLWLPLQITSRRCRPAPSSPAYSPSWASSCSWLSSSPWKKERGSPSLASFSSLPVSILFVIHWPPPVAPLTDVHASSPRPVHHDRSLHLHGPLPPGRVRLVRSLLHPGVDLLRPHVPLLRHLLRATQEDCVRRTPERAPAVPPPLAGSTLSAVNSPLTRRCLTDAAHGPRAARFCSS